MKLPLEPTAFVPSVIEIHLPYGLIGLSEVRRLEIAPLPGGSPLLSMRCISDDTVNFLAVEPQGLISDYTLELGEEEADALQIHAADDALIFNIVTVHSLQPQYVTANLAGPIVVNRRTLIAKQIVIGPRDRYPTLHPLVDERNAAQAA